jgi:zinc transport system substrate-binding protein
MLPKPWLAAAASAAAAFALAASPARADVAVVVTIKPIHAIAAAVMDGVAKPRLLVDGAASPHTYSLKPSDAAAISKADVFIRVSGDLEPFTRRVVRTLPKSVQLVTLQSVKGLELHEVREGGPFESHDHGHGHSHSHGKDKDEIDGHIWLDPDNAKKIATAIADTLAAKSPKNADTFRRNAAAFATRVDALERELATKLAPVKDKPFIVFHDAYQYFERHFGLTTAGSITVNPEVQPSARRLTQLRTKIDQLAAVCIMREPQFEPKVVTAIAQGTKARIGQLDPEGANVDPGPELYFTVMRNLATSLAECLGRTS